MGSERVVTAIIEWATTALHDHPLLAAPTLIILIGVVGLAVLEAATITIQVATTMAKHYRHRLSELLEAIVEFRGAIFPKRSARLHVADTPTIGSARSDIVQRERLSQQRLFDKSSSR